jgi:hypothetical protein
MSTERPVDVAIERVRDVVAEYWRYDAMPGGYAEAERNRKAQHLAVTLPALLAEIARLRGIEKTARHYLRHHDHRDRLVAALAPAPAEESEADGST